MMRYRGVVEGLERSRREIEKELFDEDNALESKTTRDRRLSLQPSKRLESHPLFREEPRSRIRGVGSGSQVIGRGAVSLFHSYYLWEFGSFLCFFSLVVLLLCNPNKIL